MSLSQLSFVGVLLLGIWCSVTLSLPVNEVPVNAQAPSEKSSAVARYRSLFIAVKTQNQDELEPLFTAVSTPSSPQYGHHLTLGQICDKFSPDSMHVLAIEQWAAAHGGVNLQKSACFDLITVHMPISSLQAAFEGVADIECDLKLGCNRPVAVPPSLEHAVDFIDGLGHPRDLLVHGENKGTRDYNPASRRRNAAKSSTANPAESSSTDVSEKSDGVGKGPWYPPCLATSSIPPCLRKLHNITVKQSTAKNNSQGVALFGYQFYSPTDLSLFDKKYDVPAAIMHDMNDNDPKTPGNEASLDTQYISAIGTGVETWYMHYSCTTQECHPFLTWILQIANTTNPPLVQSVSVGTTEWEYVEDMGLNYVARINQEFMKAGLRGISLLFATGDKASQFYKGKYWINFPSASPYVTAVGGVWLGELGGGPLETDPDTTGGFSNCEVHTQQEYQKAAVQEYLTEAKTEKAAQPSVFNATLRGVPDLSSTSDAYVIFQHGTETFIGGTSAACPVVAGIASLLNDARLSAGKPTMGFLNPFLYNNPDCFEDITGGSNLYGAVKGWDPATGLGTPIFSCLVEAAKQL